MTAVAVFKCSKCGNVVEARCKPGKCPSCGAPKDELIKEAAPKAPKASKTKGL